MHISATTNTDPSLNISGVSHLIIPSPRATYPPVPPPFFSSSSFFFLVVFCHSCLGAAAAFRLDRGYHGNLRGYRDEKCHLVMQSHRISSCPSLDMHDHRAATRMGLASPPPLLSARERIRRLGNARRCPPARRSYIELGFVFQNSAVIAIVMRTLYGKRCCS